MTLYAVNVQTEKKTGPYLSFITSPTFYLDSNVQGITDLNHANHIVERWLADAGLNVTGMTVIPVEDNEVLEGHTDR
jgi:hypothetical protein